MKKEVISKVIQNKGKEQNHSPVKGAKVMPGRLLMSFEITSKVL